MFCSIVYEINLDFYYIKNNFQVFILVVVILFIYFDKGFMIVLFIGSYVDSLVLLISRDSFEEGQ